MKWAEREENRALEVSNGAIIWGTLRKKVPNVLSRCHTKRRMDGLPTFFIFIFLFSFFLFFFFFEKNFFGKLLIFIFLFFLGKVDVIPKEGWTGILLLV